MYATTVITSGRVAGYLMLSGLKLLAVKTDLKDPTRMVFVFRESPLLQRYLRDYREARKQADDRRAKIEDERKELM